MSRPAPADRLRRIIDMAAYLASRPGEPVASACAHLGVDRRTLLADLDLLLLCGLPPYSPDELFEVDIEDDRITLRGADVLGRPFGVSRPEAVRLLTAGRLALELPDGADVPVLREAATKLEHALGEQPVASGATSAATHVATLQAAVLDHAVTRIRYLTYARDEESERDVEPARVFMADGSWYLAAHCRRAGAGRTFRVDRVRSAEPTGEHFVAAPDVAGFGYASAGEDLRATLVLSKEAAWVQARYPLERAEWRADGTLEVEVAAADATFLVRLVLLLGRHLVEVGPDWLRDAAGEAARAARATYA